MPGTSPGMTAVFGWIMQVATLTRA
jgi:hypothetical protein